MTCANTSFPAYIICSRDGPHHRVANLAFTVQVGDRRNHENLFAVHSFTSTYLENVGTLLIKPQDFAILEIANLETDDPIAVDVQVLNDVYKDLSAYIVDAPNAALARQKLRFQFLEGVVKRNAPFHFMTKVQVSGPHYLILDNRFANAIEKKVVFQTGYLEKLSEDKRAAIKTDFDKLYAGLKSTFNFRDFNIHIKSCGQSNAFSATETGDVTICDELMQEMSERKGALNAVILHELGHTLLNLWDIQTTGTKTMPINLQQVGFFALETRESGLSTNGCNGTQNEIRGQKLRK